MSHLHISVGATQRCNRYCRHCISDATPDGVDFTAKMAQKLVKDLQATEDEYEKIYITLTGEGEPLLNPELPKIVNVFFDGLGERLKILELITSGPLPAAHKEEERLIEIVRRNYGTYPSRLRIYQSFSLYNKTFPDRLKNIMKILCSSGCMDLSLKITFSVENFAATMKALDRAFDDLVVEKGMLVYGHLVWWMSEGFENTMKGGLFSRIASLKDPGNMVGYAHLLDCIYWVCDAHSKAMWLKVMPQSLQKLGRAKGSPQTSLCNNNRCTAIFGGYGRDIFHLSARGTYYPIAMCGNRDEVAIGTLGDPILEVLRRKEEFLAQINRRIIADGRNGPICDLCAKLASDLPDSKFGV